MYVDEGVGAYLVELGPLVAEEGEPFTGRRAAVEHFTVELGVGEETLGATLEPVHTDRRRQSVPTVHN